MSPAFSSSWPLGTMKLLSRFTIITNVPLGKCMSFSWLPPLSDSSVSVSSESCDSSSSGSSIGLTQGDLEAISFEPRLQMRSMKSERCVKSWKSGQGNTVATVKHIKIQNSNYGVATEYLTMQHNKFTNKPIYDENCLTPERAQELGMELARKAFPGHQVLVCTQKDRHNSAGNIHCHIVLNSVRKLDVPREDFILLRTANIAGMKHHSSRGFKEFFRQSMIW